ncbi:MAG: M14 family metallopeptidase [Granulosicoccaceae bacterium]
MLHITDTLPEGLLDCRAEQLHEHLSGPTLIHLPGRREQPLFVSVLLHGNEDTGWEAMRALLRDYQHRELPRALSLFIGNVSAAREGVRRLDGQNDYNRVWAEGDSAEHAMMRLIVEEMRIRNVFASIDIHNNTGLNPHYACVNLLDHRFFRLALLFSRTVVFFTRPEEVQSRAFAALCPAVTVECGQPGVPHGTEHARQFVEDALHLVELKTKPVPLHDIDLFHTVAVVRVSNTASFSYSRDDVELRLLDDLDHMNFRELAAGTSFGELANNNLDCIEVQDEQGNDARSRFFVAEDGELRTAIPVMPSMLTLDERVIRQDCLCYLMERLDPHDVV